MSVKRICSWAIGAPIAVLLVSFAVANRHWITVSFDPVNTADPWLSVSLPAFLLFFIGILIGMMVGGVVVWMRQGKWRKQARMSHEASPAPTDARTSSGSSNLVPALRQPN